MITAMNKYLFLIYHREYEAFLEKLRTIGVVHIRETKATKDVAELQDLLNLRKEIAQTKRMLASYKSEDAPAEQTLTLASEADGEAAMQDAPKRPVLKARSCLKSGRWSTWKFGGSSTLHPSKDSGKPAMK